MGLLRETHKGRKQNAAAALSTGPTSVIPAMDPTTTNLASSSTEATGDVYSTLSRHVHDVYATTATPETSTPTWVTSARSAQSQGYTPIFFSIPQPSGWGSDNTLNAHVSVHPGFIAAPIIGFIIIVGLLIVCFRGRRRQRQMAAAHTNAQEMTMQPQRSIQPYMAPSLAPSTHFSTSPSYLPSPATPRTPPPVILGPILTGADSSYLTGIDTSEDAPISPHDGPADPFADNSSIAEPPPPYRPRSVAPPTFAAAAQTHLVERSPFDDPQDYSNGDAISEISEPVGEGDDDARSVVSDLSDHHEAGVSRTNH